MLFREIKRVGKFVKYVLFALYAQQVYRRAVNWCFTLTRDFFPIFCTFYDYENDSLQF